MYPAKLWTLLYITDKDSFVYGIILFFSMYTINY